MAIDFEREVYCVLGLPFDAVDVNGAVRRIRDAAARRRACFLSTPNTNFLIGCLGDGEFRESVIESDLSVADGMPLVWIARTLGVPLRERVSGSEIFERLRRERGKPLSVYFVGGEAGVAEAACRRLAAKSGGLVCVGSDSPGFGSVEEMSSDERIRRINESSADFVVVSLGAKKGQAWIRRNRRRLSAPVISYLGAVINFVAGRVRRAPPWMQRAGLEWLWRIKEEPLLWRRYLFDGLTLLRLVTTRVLPLVWIQYRNAPRRSELELATLSVREEGRENVVCLRGAWTRENLHPLRKQFAELTETNKDLRVDLEHVTHVDASFLGLLMLAQGAQKRSGHRLACEPTSSRVRRIFALACSEFLLGDSLRPSA